MARTGRPSRPAADASASDSPSSASGPLRLLEHFLFLDLGGLQNCTVGGETVRTASRCSVTISPP